MSLDDILNSASRHRIEAVISSGTRALDDAAEQSRQLDKGWQETRARQETELKALEEKMKGAREAYKAKQEAEEPAKRVPPKPRSLSLGGEEFREGRHAAPPPPPPPPPRPVAPPPPPVERRPEPVVEQPAREARTAKTMRLGAPEEPDERGEAPKPERPKPRRAPRDDTDDDLSGRTWLR